MATTKTIQPTGTTITIPAMTDRPDASVFATDISRITDAVNSQNNNMTTKVGYSGGPVAGGSTKTFNITSTAVVLVQWNNTTLTMSIVNGTSVTTVMGNVPAGCSITANNTTIDVENGQSYGCTTYILTRST